MIFAVADHIKQVMEHTKTQTRRRSGRYQVGKRYSVQPGRTKPGVPDGKILIVRKRVEYRNAPCIITRRDALAEGGYSPPKFEALYSRMHPNWKIRYAYTFRFEGGL